MSNLVVCHSERALAGDEESLAVGHLTVIVIGPGIPPSSSE